jgi:branched-chain amino acid transport system ATP-binding protein
MLKVDSISSFYGPFQALWNVSLSVSKNEIIAIIGANGAGKTTLLRTICGLLRPKSGSIHFLNNRIDKLSPHKICQMGLSLVPEGRRLFPYMSVLENLEMGAYGKEANAKKNDTLEFVYQLFPVLKERSQQMAATLSGGEQQMLAIGRALMSKPKLLMLDEPSHGLAPIIVAKIFETIKQLREEEGVTILLVEQNVHRSLELSDRSYVLEAGKIVMEGLSKELFEDYRIKKAYLGI